MAEFAKRLRENYLAVEDRIARACQRAGRERSEVTLVAVTKYANWEWVQALVQLGQVNLGENRTQQLLERATQLTQPASWHLIGHLQSNKARSLVKRIPWIHSIDSLKLLQLIDRLASEHQWWPHVLLEVNVTGEPTKHGWTPDELRSDWEAIQDCRKVDLRGLMTMAPASDDPETARPGFQALRKLRDELQSRSLDGQHAIPDLSMGMTGDFEVAIAEGATFVRIGSALFEGLEENV